MQVWNILVLLSIFAVVFSNDVTELNDGNFEDFIKTNKYVLVDFYATWCNHCMEFLPVYDSIAAKAKETKLPFVFAKIDANTNFHTRGKHELTQYPTIRAFIDGVPVNYRDDITPQDILEFIERKVTATVRKLRNKEELMQLVNSRGLRVLLIEDDPKVIKEFEREAIETSTKARFYRTFESVGKSVIPEAAPFPSVVLFKDYGEPKVIHRPRLSAKQLLEELKDELIPKVALYNPKFMDSMMGANANKIGVGLFYKDEEVVKEFEKFRDAEPSRQYLFFKMKQEEMKEYVKNYYDLEPSDVPAIVILQKENEEAKRYVYKGAKDSNSMLDFFKKWKEGKAERDYKTAAIPTENTGPVYKVVGQSFKQEVIDDPKNVIVKFYAPWCPHCKTIAPIYEDLAKKFPQIKFVEIDSTMNEIEGHYIKGYPTLKLFLTKDKSNPIPVETSDPVAFAKIFKEKCGVDPIEPIVAAPTEEPKKEEEPKEPKKPKEPKEPKKPRRMKEEKKKTDL